MNERNTDDPRGEGRTRVWALVAACLLAMAGTAAGPGGWRHDRDRSVFREVGSRAEYQAVGVIGEEGTPATGR